MDHLEEFWGNILSRSPERIRKAFDQLDENSKGEVISHLTRMATESGWHVEQAASAKAALEVLKNFHPNS